MGFKPITSVADSNYEVRYKNKIKTLGPSDQISEIVYNSRPIMVKKAHSEGDLVIYYDKFFFKTVLYKKFPRVCAWKLEFV